MPPQGYIQPFIIRPGAEGWQAPVQGHGEIACPRESLSVRGSVLVRRGVGVRCAGWVWVVAVRAALCAGVVHAGEAQTW